MTWALDAPSQVPPQSTSVSADRVLYQFDGPQIFAGRFGFLDAFFVKIDDVQDDYLFLAAPASTRVIDLIGAAKLSVRAGFASDKQWIVQTNHNLQIVRYWPCDYLDIPNALLPASGVGLAEGGPIVPDTLDQLDAFFSLNFQGEALKRSGIEFSTFKGLVDDSYDAARRILSPAVLVGSKSATFDFRVKEPSFASSLIIAIDVPLVNLAAVRRKAGDREIDLEHVGQQFGEQRSAFFDEMVSAVHDAQLGRVDAANSQERFSLLDRIQNVIPSEENRIRSVLFSSKISDGNTRSIFVDEKTGLVLHRALREAERRPILDFGTIKIINSTSHSFVFISKRAREVTCYVNAEMFKALSDDTRFRNGCRVEVSGMLKRRRRRDEMVATDMPKVHDALPQRDGIFA